MTTHRNVRTDVRNTTTEVAIGPATIIGYGVAALTALIAAIDAISGSGLGGDGEILLKVSAVLTAVTTFGRQLQAAMAKIFPPKSDV